MRLNQKILLSLAFAVIFFSTVCIVNAGSYPSFELNTSQLIFPDTARIKSYPFQEHSFYSNLTHYWYNFYFDSFYPIQVPPAQGSIAYQVVDLDGNIIAQEYLSLGHGGDGDADAFDFDVATDKHGQRVYIVYRFSGDVEILYGIVNEETKLIDLVDWTKIEDTDTYRGVDVFTSKDGIIVNFGKFWGGQYGSRMYVSNSTTSWSTTYISSAESFWNTLKSTNLANNWYHFTKVVRFGEEGIAIGFNAFNPSGQTIAPFGIMTATYFEYDFRNVSLVGDNWDANNAFYSPYKYLPDNLESCPNFDVVGSVDGINSTAIICVTNGVPQAGLDNRILTTRITKIIGADTVVYQFINKSVISNEQRITWIYTNDRGTVNAFHIGERSNRTITRHVYNEVTGLWVNNTLVRLPPMPLWDSPKQTVWYARSSNYASQEKGWGEGTPFSILYEYLNNSYGFVWAYLDGFNITLPDAVDYIRLDNVTNNLNDTYGVMILPNEEHIVQARLHDNVTIFYADFEDAKHEVRFIYNITSNIGITEIVRKDNGTVLNVAYINDVTETDSGNYTIIDLEFIFNDRCLDYYSQIMGYGYMYNGAWINSTISTLKYSIFNLGGIPVYSGGGDYTFYDDNDIFSVGSTNDTSYAQFNVLYNKLQHMHFNVEFDINGDWDAPWGVFDNLTGGFYEYGINYWFKGEYLRGWKVRIYPSSQAVGHQHAGIDFDWVQWTVEHYIYNRTLDDYQLEQTHFLYSNFNGYDNENSVPDYHNRTSATWWIDLWFSNDDASRKVATRVNTEWYGMYEQGSAWWFGYGEFRPIIGDYSESIFYDNVYDANYSIDTTKDNVDIVEFWGRVEKVTGGDREYIMHNYLMKNKVLAQGDMLGIDTPALVETKVMDMPQTGFLAPLLKVLSDIQRMIWQGIINVIMGMGVLIDSALTAIGLPPLMSVFYNFLIGIYDVFAVIYNSFLDIISWIVESLENMIASIFVLIPRYLLFVGLLLGTFVSYYENFVLLFTGGFGGMNNFWTDYNVMQIIELYLIAIFPFVELARIEASDEPLQTLMEDVEQFFKIITAVFSIAKEVLDMAFEIIRSIIGIF